MTREIGRPTECTPELIKQFCEFRREGLPLCDCAALCNISTTSYKSWVNRGHTGEQPFATFLASLKRSEAEFKQERINLIKRSHDDDPKSWVASMTLLERLFQSEFSRNQTRINIELPQTDGADVDRLNVLANTIVDQMSHGEMVLEAGSIMLKAIEDRRKLIETMDHEQRLKETEERLKKLGA